MSIPRTRSQIGRASRDKGARFERAVATALRPWFPEARRSRDNGSNRTADTGDLAGTHPGLWWSLKDVKAAHGDPPALIAGWLTEAAVKAAGATPLVVQKRPGHADPLRSWCWLMLDDLTWLTVRDRSTAAPSPVRMQLSDVLALLAYAGYTTTPEPEESP